MNNWEKYLTNEGRKHYDMFSKHVLGRFYDPMNGTLIIDKNDWENAKPHVLQFITEKWDEQWVLTFDGNCDCWIVVEAKYL